VLTAFLDLFDEFSTVLGVPFAKEEELLDDEVERLIEERNRARKRRDYQKADAIRDQLKAKNIILEDTPQGVRWKRK